MFIFMPPCFKDKERPMDAAASKVGSVFREIDVAQPFHHPEENQNKWCDVGLVCDWADYYVNL